MNDSKDNRFKSYIDESVLETVKLNDTQKTQLKDGETVVIELDNILMYIPLSDHRETISGVLTLTTFKLSFASAKIGINSDECYQQNSLLGPNEVCLSSIDSIYQIDKSKKKLAPGHNISGKVKDILIICKNMKILEFNFKDAGKDNGKTFVNALLHHAYPKRHSLLFIYDYKEPYYNKNIFKEARLFRRIDDWKKELERTRCQNWRISTANCNYTLSPMQSPNLVVPHSVTDTAIDTAVRCFKNSFCPVWVWGSGKGAALVRMADLLSTVLDRTQENIMLEHIRKSHPEKRQPYIIDLTKDCPSPKEVQSSYIKLRELCTPDSCRLFKSQDFKFYGLMDNAKWLHYVSMCLSKAAEAADKISGSEPTTVVLQEGGGQDMNCVVSSLTQLLLDPFFRTKYGFQSLIQKEWLSVGHPFAYRLGHILNHEIEPSPIFLLFLDCVWQLLQQFPTAFQISETYLTTVWDSAHISIFDTFLFNCDHDRYMAENTVPLVLRSVWDWNEQFSDKDIALFCNPLYDDSCKGHLKPMTGVSSLDIWRQCYFRWLPNLEIRNGGRPQVDLCCRFIVSEILQLQQILTGGEMNGKFAKTKEEYLELLKKINSFFPFSYNNGQVPSVMGVDTLLSGESLETQSIINLNND